MARQVSVVDSAFDTGAGERLQQLLAEHPTYSHQEKNCILGAMPWRLNTSCLVLVWLGSALAAQTVPEVAHRYTTAHQAQLTQAFSALLSIPNVAVDPENLKTGKWRYSLKVSKSLSDHFSGSWGLLHQPPLGRISSGPPWIHTGNMDNKELVGRYDALHASARKGRIVLSRRRSCRPRRWRGLRDRAGNSSARNSAVVGS
jgi:hypothetical protein